MAPPDSHFPFRLELRIGGLPDAVLTESIGPDDLYLRADPTEEAHQMITFDVIDPDGGRLTLHGVVARPESGHRGLHVSLLGNDPPELARWRKLVARARRWADEGRTFGLRPSGRPLPSRPPTPTGPLPMMPGPTPPVEDAPPVSTPGGGSSTRAHARRSAHLRGALTRPDGGHAPVAVRDFSEGGALVTGSGRAPDVGDSVELTVTHPSTGEPLAIPGRVVRPADPVDPGETWGVGLAFSPGAAAHAPWALFGGRPIVGDVAHRRRDRSLVEASLAGRTTREEE